jgi:hypothetical protein
LEFDLSDLCALDLQLLDATGGPANDVELVFVSGAHSPEVDFDEWTTRATTDSAGRVAVLLEPGRWFVFGRNERDMVQLPILIERDEQRELRMQPMPAMRGRVVDAKGAPIAGARMHVYSSSSRGRGEPPCLDAIAGKLNWHWMGRVRTDADGSFECSYLAAPNRGYKARFHFEDRRSAGFPVEVHEDLITITVEDKK